MEERNAPGTPPGPASSALLCGQASRSWRRDLGALAWAALEELALTAHHDDKGWVSPVGVRVLATGIGTTDAAALGALAALGRSGLVALEVLTDHQGQRHCGYRLYLPPGLQLGHCPPSGDGPAPIFHRLADNQDALRPNRHDRCPSHQDRGRCRPPTRM